MEVKDMKMEDIETRMAEINELLNDENADIDALTEEVNSLEARSNEIKLEVEKRNALVSKVAEGQIGVVIEERKQEEQPWELLSLAQSLWMSKAIRNIPTSPPAAMPDA